MDSEKQPGERPRLSRNERLFRIRHSAAHIMAQAVVQMFPEASLAIGPPIANGFYYDFELPRTLTPDDLVDIQKRMKKIAKKRHPFVQETKGRAELLEYFRERGQGFKVELIEGLPEDAELTTFENAGFVDLCAGPHVAWSTQVKHFKLLKVSGAYWRGNEKGPMLQRIYGTVWEKKEELEAYLAMLEEAKKRDHRRLGKDLDLFYNHAYSPGGVFWTPRGYRIYQTLVEQWRESHDAAGYVEICNPMLYDRALFEESGHWDHYEENLFTMEAHNRTWCLKPMNCPDTMLFFRSKKRSYRELPLRVSEGGTLHRNELPGSLSGLTRVRQFQQDDAHLFVTAEQLQDEIVGILKLVDETYGLFDISYDLFLSTRPDDYMGEIEQWDQAEAALANALEAGGKSFQLNPGDGAFYGPKIDFAVKDSLGRAHQCATLQLDFQIPQRFELGYVDSDNTLKTPIVIHRAIYGSLERFVGVLLEHLAGVLPTWLAPEQVRVMSISQKASDYAMDVVKTLRAAGLRAEADVRSDKVNLKVREAELMKIPWMLIVGEREAEARSVSVRHYQQGRLGAKALDDVVEDLVGRTKRRDLDVEIAQFTAWADGDEDDGDLGADMESRGY